MPYIYDWDKLWPKVEQCLSQGINRPADVAKRVGVPYQALLPKIDSMKVRDRFDIKSVKRRKGGQLLRTIRSAYGQEGGIW